MRLQSGYNPQTEFKEGRFGIHEYICESLGLLGTIGPACSVDTNETAKAGLKLLIERPFLLFVVTSTVRVSF